VESDDATGDLQDEDQPRVGMPSLAEAAVWGLALLAAAFVPAALLETGTLHAFRPRSFASAFLIVLALSCVVIAVAWFASRDVGFAIRAAVAATFAVFWWGYLDVPSEIIAERVPLLTLDVVIVVVVAAICYAILRYGRFWIVSVLLLAMFLTIAGRQIVEITSLRIVAQPSGSVVKSIDPPEQSPNVFVLILDGYPRSDVLNTVLESSDATFLSALNSIGIATNAGAWSNYDRTYASVGSMFGLETMFTVDDDIGQVLPRLRGVSGGDGEFLRAFRDAGYSVTVSPSSWNGSRCDSIVDDCVAIGVTRSSLYWLLRATVFAPMVPLILRSPWTDVSLRQIDSMARIHADAMHSQQPSIVFMHVALPHPPIVLDATCKEFQQSWRIGFRRAQTGLTVQPGGIGLGSARAFGAQVQCVGTLVADQLGRIVEEDPDAVIVVLSDHGTKVLELATLIPSEFNDDQIWERLANLTAFGGPPECEGVLDQASVVGVLREVVRCLLGADIVDTQLDGFLVPSELGISEGAEPVRVVFDEVWPGLIDDVDG
jgi:hypothetical protein